MAKFWNWAEPQADNPERVLFLSGTIAEETWFDDEVSPAEFKADLQSGTGPVTVWINSPGGDCVAAAQIYNMLIDYPHDVTIKIDGIAASAASVIAMAGTKVLMSPPGLMMIHNPMTVAGGDAAELERAVAMLGEVKESIMNAYEIKTGLSRTKLAHMMDAETWMSAKTAQELGFIDGIISADDHAPAALVPDTMAYSRAEVVNSLAGKIAEKCKIQQQKTPEPSGRAVDDLLARLQHIKNYI